MSAAKHNSDTAKIFMNGRSQAVRLPAAYRFDCSEVYIRSDPDTGDVILSRAPGSWGACFKLMDEHPVYGDFEIDRQNDVLGDNGVFDDV